MRVIKKGEAVIGSTAGIILGVVSVALLIYFFVSLYLFQQFDPIKETAESYRQGLTEAIELADKGKTPDFGLWMEGAHTDFYLVYFGEKISFESEGESFVFNKNFIDNNVCICYKVKDENICSVCKSLNYPAIYEGEEGNWVINEGDDVQIKKEGENYVFSKV